MTEEKTTNHVLCNKLQLVRLCSLGLFQNVLGLVERVGSTNRGSFCLLLPFVLAALEVLETLRFLLLLAKESLAPFFFDLLLHLVPAVSVHLLLRTRRSIRSEKEQEL
jgi:hypothetical protein